MDGLFEHWWRLRRKVITEGRKEGYNARFHFQNASKEEHKGGRKEGMMKEGRKNTPRKEKGKDARMCAEHHMQPARTFQYK
jgi:hypothetical protein